MNSNFDVMSVCTPLSKLPRSIIDERLKLKTFGMQEKQSCEKSLKLRLELDAKELEGCTFKPMPLSKHS